MAASASIEIRCLGQSDATDYRAIRLAALRGEPELFGSTFEAESAKPLEAFAERLTSTAVFAAYVHGRIVGMAGFKQEANQKDRHKGFLWGMYVEPDYRRQGISARLVVAVLERAQALVEQVTLSVVSDNHAAIALYRAQGFECYGMEPRALKSTTGYHDEVLMVRFMAT